MIVSRAPVGAEELHSHRAWQPPGFYGWYVAAAGAAIAFVAWGVVFWNVGVFLYAFQEHRGWSRAALSGSVALLNVLAGLTGLVVGRIIDRIGPRVVLIWGGFVIGCAMFGFGRAGELWEVYLFNGLLGVGYGCTHVLVLSALISRWFARRRALAMMITLTGSSTGGLVLVPLSTALIARFDIFTAAATLACIAWGLVLPAAILVVRNRPADLGLWPDGDRTLIAAGTTASAEVPWTVRDALRTKVWWTITLAFALMLMGQIAFLVHQVSLLSPRLGVQGAAGAVGVTTVAGILGRFFFGWAGDRIPRRRLAVGSCLLQAGGVLGSVYGPGELAPYLSAAAMGFTIGIVVALHPLMMAESFGTRSFGTVYGPGYLATQLAGAAGPALVGALADLTDGYRLPFTLTASAAVAAAGLLLVPARLSWRGAQRV